MTIGGIAFGLGIGIIVGYFLGRRSRTGAAGFPVVPPETESTTIPHHR
jgi:hypothetical protein